MLTGAKRGPRLDTIPPGGEDVRVVYSKGRARQATDNPSTHIDAQV